MSPFIGMIRQNIVTRAALKTSGKYGEADKIRDNLKSLGFVLEDTKRGTMVSIPGTDFMTYVETDLKYLVERYKTNE